MHHAQVDRMWAFWEAIMPSSPLFTASYKGQSRFNSKSGSTITPDSPLQPFYQANGKFHTSNTVKSIQGMGYSYQGIEYWQKSQAQIKSSVTTIINQLYGPNSGKKRNAPRDFLSDIVTDVENLIKTRYFAKISVNVTEVTVRPAEINVYVGGQKAGSLIVMKLPAEGTVNGGFTIDNPMQSILHGGLRNAVQAFTEDIEVEILSVSFPPSLHSRPLTVTISTSHRQDVYLFADPQAQKDGQAIPLETVPSLSIDLEVANVTLPSALDQLPKYGQRSRHRAKAAQRGHRFAVPHIPPL
jgi:tyrosinase